MSYTINKGGWQMHFLKKPWMIIIASCIIIIGVFALKNPFTQASPLSKEEIETQLVAMYDGEVEDLKLRKNRYEAKLLKDGAEYTVQADAESGKVLFLEQTKEAPPEKPIVQNDETETETENETPPIEEVDPPEVDEEQREEHEVDSEQETDKDEENKDETEQGKENSTEETDEQEEKQTEEEPTTLISKEEAVNIALNELPEGMVGEVDDVDFVETTEGGYYLVEIEIDTDEDEDEVIYQIHAISGDVLTTKWDD